MTPERLKEILSWAAVGDNRLLPGDINWPLFVRELVAEVERLQGEQRAALRKELNRPPTETELKAGLAPLVIARLEAKLAVAREALAHYANRMGSGGTARAALARIDGDGTEGWPPKQEDCPAEFLAVANTLEPLTSEDDGTEGKEG